MDRKTALCVINGQKTYKYVPQKANISRLVDGYMWLYNNGFSEELESEDYKVNGITFETIRKISTKLYGKEQTHKHITKPDYLFTVQYSGEHIDESNVIPYIKQIMDYNNIYPVNKDIFKDYHVIPSIHY